MLGWGGRGSRPPLWLHVPPWRRGLAWEAGVLLPYVGPGDLRAGPAALACGRAPLPCLRVRDEGGWALVPGWCSGRAHTAVLPGRVLAVPPTADGGLGC